MEIVIIGSGNVATILGRRFREAGHTIVQVYSRNATAASALAYEWDCESINYATLLYKKADVYIIAVPDKAIAEVAETMQFPEAVIAHTAASVSKDILKNVSPHHGVFYPLQSLRKESSAVHQLPLFVDGSSALAKKRLNELATSISGEMVREATDEQRLRMHVAAVIVSNFPNHLYALAQDYCLKEGLDFSQLQPLIEETATRVRQMNPRDAQTGPAIRQDTDTLRKHIELLDEHPPLKSIYLVLTQSIQQQ